jgi:uncharacterized protein YwgA
MEIRPCCMNFQIFHFLRIATMDAETTNIEIAPVVNEKKESDVDLEIAKTLEKLNRLREKKKETEKRAREKNQKAVLELIKTEKLDMIPIEKWESAISTIKTALGVV